MSRVACALAFSLLLVAPVHAAEAADPLPHEADPKRPVTDYDGRPPPPASAGDAALWVPRVALFPPWVVFEYGLRKPIGAVIKAKPNGVPGEDSDHPRFAPSVLADLGFRPWIGVYSAWEPSWARDHELRGYLAFGGLGAMSETLADRVRTSHGTLGFRESWTRRDDARFHGLGPVTERRDARHYAVERVEVGSSFDVPLHRSFAHVLVDAGVRAVRFGEAGCCQGQPSLPPVVDNYTVLYERVVVGIDTRPVVPPRSFGAPPPRTGIRAAVEGEADFDVAHRARSWVRTGAVLAGYWDIANQRVVSLTLNAHLTEPLSGSGLDLPFTELPTLGGDAPLRGFRAGRLTGRTAATATLGYEWSIWTWLAGVLDASVGNVFGAHFRGFAPELFRLSGTGGFHVLNSNDHFFEVLAGFGTEPFTNGFKPDSFRLLFGMTRRF